MKKSASDIMVSIITVTYNHEKFIRQAIEGFLMQKTDFKFEVLIGEDCSTDNTRKIIEEYALKYPTIIKLITSKTNVGAYRNLKRVVSKATGKYMALCDGDDYWTDSSKLQKQVDFLESNDEYVMCCHYCKQIDYEGNVTYVHEKPVSLNYSYNDLILYKQVETSTASIMTYSKEITELFKKEWVANCNAADKFIKLFTTSQTGKKIFVMPEVMSCYRRHPGGIWSVLEPEVITQKQLNDFNIIIQNFEHNLFQKLRLLFVYIKRFFVFEIRKSKVSGAMSTIRSIYS